MTTYCEFTMAITALADLLASKINDEELAILAAIFTQLGDTLSTIAVYKENCSAKETKDN